MASGSNPSDPHEPEWSGYYNEAGNPIPVARLQPATSIPELDDDLVEDETVPYVDIVRLLEQLPHLVRSARQQRGLSHREAGQQMGYAYGDLCRFEAGTKRPGIDSVIKILRWLGDDEILSSAGTPPQKR